VSSAAPKLGQYTLGQRVGAGRLAQVYRASGPAGDVAVKLLAPDAELDDPAAVARFQREIDILGRVRHPNVIELLDSGIDAELGPYLVTPYIDGRTLRELIAVGRVEPALMALAAREIARGLAAIHAVGLIHRDLKPENVMVRPDGSLAIIDLGLAWGAAHTRYTEEGAVAGSVPYMAPEQIEGAEACPGTDLWALAVIAHEWITGSRPFARPRQSEEVAAILSARFEPLAERDPRVDETLGALFDSCLAREPSARPADGARLASELDAHARGDAREAMRDPAAWSRAEARARADELAADARALIDRGKPFAAGKLVDRALCHCPEDPAILELVDAVGKSPVRTRRRWPYVVAALVPALALAALLYGRTRGGADAAPPGALAESEAENADAGPVRPPLPQPFAGLELLDPAALSNRDPVQSEELRQLAARPGQVLLDKQMYGKNPYELLLDVRLHPEALKADPDSHVEYARALLATYRHDEGIAELDAVAAAHPERPDVWLLRGEIALRRGEFDDADRLLSGAIERDPGSDEALRDRGRLRRIRGRTRDAYDDLIRSLAVNPHQVLALRETAKIYRQAGRPRAAIPLMERAVKLAPEEIDVWIQYALVSEDRDALPLLDRALTIDPKSPRAHRERCILLDRLADARAVEACAAARAGNVADADVILARASAYARAGDPTRAHLELAGGTGVVKDDPRLYARMAELEDSFGHRDLAAASRRKACRLGDRASCRALVDDSDGMK